MLPTEPAKRAKTDLYDVYTKETMPLGNKINSYVKEVRDGMDALMKEVGCRAAILNPAQTAYANREMNNEVQLRTLLTYLLDANSHKDNINAMWTALQAVIKPLMTSLDAMAKYLYAYKVIRNSFNAVRAFFCWTPHEMTVLYLLEYINFTRGMDWPSGLPAKPSAACPLQEDRPSGQSAKPSAACPPQEDRREEAWFDRGEAAIFDLAAERCCLHLYGLGKSMYPRVIEARQAKRRAEFEEMYPRPALQNEMDALVTRTWCTVFLKGDDAVVAFDRTLAALLPTWDAACSTVASAVFQPTIDVNILSLKALAQIDMTDAAASLYEFWAAYMPLSAHPAAVKTAVLNECRLPAMLRVICAMLKRCRGCIPVWIVELAAMHRSHDQLAMLRNELRGPVPATWSGAGWL